MSYRSIFDRFFKSNPSSARPHILFPRGVSRGAVALSYIKWPFEDGWDSSKARGHTNAYEAVVIAEAWRDLGFRVEIVDYLNTVYIPSADCRIAIDIHNNLERWAERLPPFCFKILHATGPHWLEWNLAELNGLSAIRDRKCVALQSRRQVKPSRGIEVADHLTVLGNDYTSDTFAFAGKPFTRIPLSSAYEFSWPEGRDFSKAKRKFFWVASYGMVHKGLDLVLDAFAGMPELELTVCGRPEKEKDFYSLYEKELLRTQNIKTRGWIDMATSEFQDLACEHGTIIYPSKAEGGAGSAIHCMHAGMLPACTKSASIDLEDFGISINSDTVEAVQSAARRIASMPDEEVESRARKAWEHVRKIHTRKEFKKNYRNFAERIADKL